MRRTHASGLSRWSTLLLSRSRVSLRHRNSRVLHCRSTVLFDESNRLLLLFLPDLVNLLTNKVSNVNSTLREDVIDLEFQQAKHKCPATCSERILPCRHLERANHGR
jgi:hypothetical protein